MRKHIIISFVSILLISVFMSTGCSEDQNKKKSPQKVGEQTDIEKEDEKTESEAYVEESADKGKEEQRSVQIYYVDDETGEVTGKGVYVLDEYDIWEALKEAGVLTDECKLISVKINKEEKTIDLDFNADTGNRIRSMGTSGEIEIMGCVINTYLEAYDCDGIKIMEEGNTFVSAHGVSYDGYSGEIIF